MSCLAESAVSLSARGRARFSRLAFLLVFLAGAPPSFAHQTTTSPSDHAAVVDTHRQLVERRIEAYNKAFSDVEFVHFEGGENWHGEMIALVTAIGEGAVPVDYEHPESTRADLTQVTLERLAIMLKTSRTSATTFRLPRANPFDREYLCVITLNPDRSVTSEFDITRAFLGADADTMRRVNPRRFLEHDAHLAFALDHEAFHCLSSIHHGGQPRTSERLHAAYDRYRRENASDAFALAMHLRNQGEVTRYARNVTHMRALQPFLGDPDRGTFETLRAMLAVDPRQLTAMPVADIVSLARDTAARAIGTYDDFIRYRVATYQAARALGLHVALDADIEKQLAKQPVDSDCLATFIARYRYYRAQLSTDTDISLRPVAEPDRADR